MTNALSRSFTASSALPSAGTHSAAVHVLHLVPLPPPWTGIGVSVQQLLESAPLRAQVNTVINTSLGKIGGSGSKRPTPRRIVRHLWLAAQAGRLVRQRNIQVVHLHGSSHDLSFIANWLSLQIARRAGARTIWHLHEDLGVVQFPGSGSLTRKTFASLASRVDVLAVMTHKDRLIAGELIDQRRVVVIPETCGSEMLEMPVERGEDGFRVLFVGWLSRAKGVYDLLEVADRARRRLPAVVFDVLGAARSDQERASIERLINWRGLKETVLLHGVKTGQEKFEAFARAQVLFMPTHWDAFPVTVLEAMAAGLPVVGTQVGGLPIMLQEGAGAFLSRVSDVDAMASRLVELGGAPQLRHRMGAANRDRFVDTYHPTAVGQKTVAIYRRLAYGNLPTAAHDVRN